MRKETIRNLLIIAGAYYLSVWLEMAAVLAVAPITNRLTFTGEFEGVLVMPIVLGIPSAIVMAIMGAAAAWAVESVRPMLWALLLGLAYGISSALAPHWARAPETAADRVFLALRVLFPAIACIAGAATLGARLRHSERVRSEAAGRRTRG
jgi:hypothetical protein